MARSMTGISASIPFNLHSRIREMVDKRCRSCGGKTTLNSVIAELLELGMKEKLKANAKANAKVKNVKR